MVDLANFDVADGNQIGQYISVAGEWAVNLAVILGAVALTGVILYFVWREIQYKIPVTLHRIVGQNQIIESKDRAWINKRKGEIRLRKTKVEQTIPANKFFVKTLKSWRLYGQWDGHKAIQWQSLNYTSPLTFEPDTYDVYNQMGWRIRNAAIRHANESFFEKYGNQIMFMSTVLVIAIVLIILFDSVGNIGPSIQGGLTEWARVIEGLDAQRIN